MRRPPNPRPHHAAGRDMRITQSVPCRALRFLSSTVHGAFSLFAKERMGGAMDQPSLVSNPPRPQGRVQSPSPPGELLSTL